MKEQLLNESISSMIEEIEPAPYRAGPYGARVLSALRELQERRKADSTEPVAWTDAEELRAVEKDGFAYLYKANPVTPNADPRRVILLYRHAQPAVRQLVELTDEQIDTVLDYPGNIEYVIADKRERLRMFAREILRVATIQQQPAPDREDE